MSSASQRPGQDYTASHQRAPAAPDESERRGSTALCDHSHRDTRLCADLVQQDYARRGLCRGDCPDYRTLHTGAGATTEEGRRGESVIRRAAGSVG